MSMFDAYKLVPDSYVPNNLHYVSDVPPIPKKPLVAYNKAGEPVGFTWNRTDTICLEFNTTGNVVYEEGDIPGIEPGLTEDAETYFTHSAKTLQLYIYDFRYNVVAFAEAPAHAKTAFITTDILKTELVPGIYKLQLNLVDKNTNIQYSLIKGDDCQIFIR